MTTETASAAPRHMVVTSTKSVGIQILLIFFLGPIGLFYSTVKGALILIFGAMAVLGFGAPIIAAMFAPKDAVGGAAVLGFFGGMLISIPILWIVSWIWGIVAVKAFNRKLTGSV